MYTNSNADSTRTILVTGAATFVTIRSFRSYGTLATATATSAVGLYHSTTATGLTSRQNAEKINSRSATCSYSQGSAFVNGSNSGQMKVGIANFNSFAMIFAGKYAYVYHSGESTELAAQGNASTISSHFETFRPPNRSIRRTTKPGFFPYFGNNMCMHSGTAGSFRINAPHFESDIAFIDKTAWVNGMNQSDFYNINLFPAPISSTKIYPYSFGYILS